MNEVLVVERELSGVRLHDLLAGHWPKVHRRELRRLVAAGDVRVNGEVCLSDRRLRLGDVVLLASVPGPAGGQVRADRRTPAPLEVRYESSTALVVAKPAGIPSVPDRSGRESGVHGRLQELRADQDLRIVHRLDRDTSGCLLLAKGLDAARHFDAAFRERRVHKVYVALVAGVPRSDRLQVDAWLGPDPRRPGKVVSRDEPRRGFREAHTEVLVRARFDRHALLELHPTTGRGHQLRAHLQSIGHPIVGDGDYGGEVLLLSRLKRDYKKRTGVEERPLVQRMFLHAERLSFEDVGGQRVDVETPLPDDLATALRRIEKHQSRRRTQCD